VAEMFGAWPNFISTAPGVAYAYLDDYRKNRKDITFEADTLEKLAAAAGLDAQGLRRTVETYNAGTERGERPPLERPPYFALGPAKSWILLTDGGLDVDIGLRVLDAARMPVRGLYAAGSTGQGGLLLEGHGHHLGWAFTSGRVAGRNAALAC
jgi:succinate dehydrogenase/fumarate reductase flavoprotein subunit